MSTEDGQAVFGTFLWTGLRISKRQNETTLIVAMDVTRSREVPTTNMIMIYQFLP
jgi:hypothetical protein